VSPPLPLAVLDTNVLVSGIITSHPEAATARIVGAATSSRLPILLSPSLLAEYWTLLTRERIRRKHGLPDHGIEEVMRRLIQDAVIINPPLAVSAPGPAERHAWALLLSDPESILITGDKLLITSPPAGRIVISPAVFVRRGPL
jgi:predicted nucleic acid-binding protein